MNFVEKKLFGNQQSNYLSLWSRVHKRAGRVDLVSANFTSLPLSPSFSSCLFLTTQVPACRLLEAHNLTLTLAVGYSFLPSWVTQAHRHMHPGYIGFCQTPGFNICFIFFCLNTVSRTQLRLLYGENPSAFLKHWLSSARQRLQRIVGKSWKDELSFCWPLQGLKWIPSCFWGSAGYVCVCVRGGGGHDWHT